MFIDKINRSNSFENEKNKFTERKYQLELFEKAKNQNSIVVLETGTGKTMIAIYLIYYHLAYYDLKKKVKINNFEKIQKF